jgi:ribonuclease J
MGALAGRQPLERGITSGSPCARCARSAFELVRAGCLDQGLAVWSLWPGYLEAPSGLKTQELLERAGAPLLLLHSSGHANVDDLRRFADAVAADRVVPIHTDEPHAYERLFDGVEVRRDGEWWDV